MTDRARRYVDDDREAADMRCTLTGEHRDHVCHLIEGTANVTDCAKCSACDHYTCERTTQSRACESCGDALEGTDRVTDPDAPVAEAAAFVRIERAEWQGMNDRCAIADAAVIRVREFCADSDRMPGINYVRVAAVRAALEGNQP